MAGKEKKQPKISIKGRKLNIKQRAHLRHTPFLNLINPALSTKQETHAKLGLEMGTNNRLERHETLLFMLS